MFDDIFMDIRTKTVVRIIRKTSGETVMVMKLKDKSRYITDMCNLRKLGIKK